MRNRTAIMIAAVAVAVPAYAQDTKVDPDHIMAVMKDAGYQAEYFNDDAGYRQILSKTGNYQFLVEMYDCTDGSACETLEFYSNFPMEDAPTKERLDAYPGPREGARIALDRRGEATVRQELDINGESGFTDEQFLDHLERWETLLARFTEYLTEPPGNAAAPVADEPAIS